MAIHSSILAWRISWTEEAGGLHSMGAQRVGHNSVVFTFTFNLEGKKNHFLYNSIMPTFHNSELPHHSILCKYTFYYSNPIPRKHNFDSKSQAFTW